MILFLLSVDEPFQRSLGVGLYKKSWLGIAGVVGAGKYWGCVYPYASSFKYLSLTLFVFHLASVC